MTYAFPSLVRSLCCITFLFASAGCEKAGISPTPDSAQVQFAPNFALAKTNNELEILQKNPKNNLLRTPKDYDALVVSGQTPLSKLSKTAQDAFKKHIMFREGIGVAGIEYGELESQLSYDEFAQVLAAFGLDVKQGYWGLSRDPKIMRQLAQGGGPQTNVIDDQLEMPTDYKGYKCDAPHSCLQQEKAICMSACDSD